MLLKKPSVPSGSGAMDNPMAKRIKLEYQFNDLDRICIAADDSTVDEMQTRNASTEILLLDFPGPCNFGIFFRRDSTVVNSCLYSQTLNKIFVRMGNIVHIHFTLDHDNAPADEMFIRATLVYCGADHMHHPVKRCPLHSIEDDPLSVAHSNGSCNCPEYNLVGHVIRSTSNNAMYCYDEETDRHSVIVPIRHGHHDLLYNFACKSSCARGMERRPVRIVFTLEDENGAIFGRCSLNVKVCSCPKRDMDRQEKEVSRFNGDVSSGSVGSRNRPDNKNSNHPSRDSDAGVKDCKAIRVTNSSKPNVQVKNLILMINQAKRQIAELQDFCSNIEKVLDSLECDI